MTDSTSSNFELDVVNDRSSDYNLQLTFMQKLKYESIDNFHPVYFLGFLGTGITANILRNFPYKAKWLEVLGTIMFVLTIILFLSTNVMLIWSCIRYPKRIYSYNCDPAYSIYFAVYSMGYTTIVNAIHLLVEDRFPILLWVLWWIGVIIAVYNSTIMFFLSFLAKINNHSIESIHASILMPIVCPCVISSTGHLIAPVLPHTQYKIITEILSLMLLFISLILFHGVGALYIARLVLCKIPNTQNVFTSYLPIGFTGQSGYSIMLFGRNMHNFIPDKSLGNSFLVTSGFISVFFLSGGYIYLFIAIISTISKIKPFAKNIDLHQTKYGLIKWNKGFWTLTFPIGTMSLINGEIGKVAIEGHELKFFKVMSAVFGVSLMFICLGNLIGLSLKIYKLFLPVLIKPKQIDIKV